MNAVARHSPDLIEQYEALRCEAITCAGPRGRGLALFVARGMSAWMAASGSVVTQPVEAPRVTAEWAVPYGHTVIIGERERLGNVLANMVLACVEVEEVGK